MKTLFFIQESISISIDVSKRAFDSIGPVTSNFQLSDWMLSGIAIVCFLYTAVALIKAYYLLYKSPKQQNKWLEERFPEEKEEDKI